MIEPLILGATARLLVEIYQRFFIVRPCEHTHQATYHSTGKRKCYDCGAERDIVDNNYAKHTR